MVKTSAVLLAGGVLLGATIARADSPGPNVLPLQVIAIQSDDADDQADALTAALRSRVRALHGFSLADGDYALEVLTLGLKCGEIPDEPCQAKIGQHIHADRYIWGTLKRSKTSRQVTADLHFWSRGRPPIRSQVIYSDNLTTPGDEVLKRLADDMLAKLIGTKSGATPAPAAGSAPGPSPPPALAAGTLALPSRSASPSASSADEPIAERGGDGRRTAGWAGVGLGGVLIAAGFYSVVRVHDIDTNERFDLYRQGFPAGDDICDKARAGQSSKIVGAATPTEMQDFCSEATTFQMLQYVFFGLGAVSAGAGVYILATDKGAPPPAAQSRWSLAPSVSRSGGRLQFRVAF
jgi:hypothetical protein